jgi:hypothetical protein
VDILVKEGQAVAQQNSLCVPIINGNLSEDFAINNI